MWLKSYLDFSADRPMWAYIADDLMANHVAKSCKPKHVDLRINTFMQKWNPKMRGLPQELKGMINVARKYSLRIEGLAFSRDIMRALPMWDHIYAPARAISRLLYPSRIVTCLRCNHHAKLVGDFERLAEVLKNGTHRASANCGCAGCKRLRDDDACENPHLCCTRARDLIVCLPDKWNPMLRHPEDYERDGMKALEQQIIDEDEIPFDRCITTYGDASQVFRIFTSSTLVFNGIAPMELCESGPTLEVATDGSCTNNGDADARAGAGVFIAVDSELNRSVRIPEGIEQSNQTGEMIATLTAANL
ncbi:hypothetical protein L227DRAFT_481117, partial [Lentinus tigrinus ALCF2SS1-6]